MHPWTYVSDLPAGPRSPMMCMVCMALLTTWLFFTNSSVGSQLMIFNLEKLKSLKKNSQNDKLRIFLKKVLDPLKLDSAADPPTWCVVLAVFVADLPSSQQGLWGWIYLCLLIQQSTVQKKEHTRRKTMFFHAWTQRLTHASPKQEVKRSYIKHDPGSKIHLCTNDFHMLTDWLNG